MDAFEQTPIRPAPTGPAVRPPELQPRQIAKHVVLFAATFLMTMLAGMIWRNSTDLLNLSLGVPYAVAILFILSCHEFGHYFAARYHGVRVTLPYYIPMPPVLSMLTFGTMGAVIRIKSAIPSRRALLDIGIAGPIAGLVASILVLIIGFQTLPGHEFLLGIHPDYDFATGASASAGSGMPLTFGAAPLYHLLESLFAHHGAYVPPMSEMYHYPLLMAGWFGLLVTALNLLPAAQLDGGHVTYALFGRMHARISRITAALLALLGVAGFLPAVLVLLRLESLAGQLVALFPTYDQWLWPGWLLWAVFITLMRFDHPPVPDETSLDGTRTALGYGAYLMLLLCLMPVPVFLGV
jgi:membrane-associated protease RseP (regulator of RpoE activity)